MHGVVRWWVYRGWAIAATVLLAVPAAFLSPPYPINGAGWPSQCLFGVAALLYLALALRPESPHLRLTAATVGTFATALRALTFLLDGQIPIRARLVGSSAWLLAMLFCAMAPEFTERYTRGAGDRCWRP